MAALSEQSDRQLLMPPGSAGRVLISADEQQARAGWLGRAR